MRVCTLKAQQDFRYEENIDAFSMSGQHGRIDGDIRRGSDGEGSYFFIVYICWVASELGPGGGDTSEEAGRSANLSIESVIEWKRIVGMYYQLNGKNPDDGEEEDLLHKQS